MHRSYKYIVVTLTILSFLFISGPARSDTGKIHWLSYKEGIKKIKAEHKKGYVHFYTSWCTYCKLMDKQTFNDKKVIKYLNENFIAIRVNAEDKANRAIVRRYSAYQYPFNIFFNEDASGIGNRPGFIPPDMFISILKYLHTDSYKKISFSDYTEKQ
ncbi:MAG: DUF255 domain-containing protein [Deltaproteobacteria bacterium]|nr:DUF255 domain-containing protein [Deltaproteobacteria bacterium]